MRKSIAHILSGLLLAFFSLTAGAVDIAPNTQLVTGQYYYSPQGKYFLVMQGDGNLVYYRANGTARWNTQTQAYPGAWAVMQGDGNFAIYTAGGQHIWSAGVQSAGAYLGLQDDGNLVIRRASDQAALWHIGGDVAPPQPDIEICDNQGIPAGHAVVRRFTGNTCRGLNGSYSRATRTVKPLISPMNVCRETNLPQGWVVTAMATTTDCINSTFTDFARETWTIAVPSSPMRVCSRTVIPAGYVVTGAATDVNCAHADFSSTYAGYDIKIPGQHEQVVCSWSPIPPGYSITNTFSWAPCSGGTTASLNAVSITRN
ncbi:hypothetical protein ACSFA2_03785 [Variovorax sp. LT2P21]|uniref:hypothetical protein n=1 Tax=Variovorax sp. LT2P21 TaxID=3443731 RepID=UPI003F46DB12